jgi:hypothetical protein
LWFEYRIANNDVGLSSNPDHNEHLEEKIATIELKVDQRKKLDNPKNLWLRIMHHKQKRRFTHCLQLLVFSNYRVFS